MHENIEELLRKPLSEMNGLEFCSLIRHALLIKEPLAENDTAETPVRQCTGIYKLKYELGISESRLRKLFHDGVLDEAVLYRTENGRICTFDIEKARKLIFENLKKE